MRNEGHTRCCPILLNLTGAPANESRPLFNYLAAPVKSHSPQGVSARFITCTANVGKENLAEVKAGRIRNCRQKSGGPLRHGSGLPVPNYIWVARQRQIKTRRIKLVMPADSPARQRRPGGNLELGKPVYVAVDSGLRQL